MSPAIEMTDSRRSEFLRLLLISAFAHGLVVSAVIAVPLVPGRGPLPAVVTVDLVAAPRGARPPTPAPKPLPKPLSKPLPKPKPVAKKVLLPAKPRAEPAPPKAPPKREKPKPAEYEDVLAQLRAEHGEPRPELGQAEVKAAESVAPGIPVSAGLLAWVRAVEIQVGSAWLLAPGLKAQGLVAHVRVRLDASGNVVGEPKLTRRSGNPWFDDSLLRAIEKASPLPAPPRPGEWDFIFDPEVYF
jgi:TonB family protein